MLQQLKDFSARIYVKARAWFDSEFRSLPPAPPTPIVQVPTAPILPAPTAAVVKRIDYVGASRRHLRDGQRLASANRNANAGQLFGYSIECALKALVVATGARTNSDGDLHSKDPHRKHLPYLSQLLLATATLPNGRLMNAFQAQMPNLAALNDWNIDFRYYDEAHIPLGSVPGWGTAAREAGRMLDDAIQKGIVT